MSTECQFVKQHSLEERREEATRIRSRYPKRIPVIVEPSKKSVLPPLDKIKYLVPGDLTVGQFAYVVRKRLKLKPETAIFVLVNNSFPSTSTEMCFLYEEHVAEDGFLYVNISGENTFGTQL